MLAWRMLTSEAAVPLKIAWIPAHLWYLLYSFINHTKSAGYAGPYAGTEEQE